MEATTGPRPCKLPQIQIDTWGTASRRQPSGQSTAAHVANRLCVMHAHILAHSALQGAQTVRDITNAICRVKQPVHVYIKSGQVYMHDGWRVRYRDMPDELKAAVTSVRDPDNLQRAFAACYNAEKIIEIIYTFIGPARAEAVQCLLLLSRHSA